MQGAQTVPKTAPGNGESSILSPSANFNHIISKHIETYVVMPSSLMTPPRMVNCRADLGGTSGLGGTSHASDHRIDFDIRLDIGIRCRLVSRIWRGWRAGPYLAIVQQYNQSGEPFRIVGHCQSSCTIFLAIRNVCIEPGASLLFHAAGTASTTSIMRSSYNSALSAYLDAHHALDTGTFFTISGAEMTGKFGYRRCR